MLGTRTALLGLSLAASVGLGVVFATGVERDERTGGDRYELNCRLLVASDNESLPGPLFGLPPAKTPTSFLVVGIVKHGSFSGLKLDGTKFAVFAALSGGWDLDRRLEAVSIYLDEDATAAQRRALATALMSDPAFRSKATTAVSTTRIALHETSKDPLGKKVLEIGKDAARGEVEFAPIRGGDGRNPVAVRNPYSRFDDKEPVALGVVRVRFADHGREMNVTNGSGELHWARLGGVVSGIVETPPPPPLPDER